ncbi:hypothetical protein NUU61_007411 [Penicillium alfredii]|uniref:Uncharacterized protein n=1 Tax=Penicillium alfredii TaxID=1506179 RepID=A0A9W9F2U3_9EURO|nr:uncharacterized protein NUU61_007411 [Penicillium alfredii]KAJ5092541.1 hypothetical protein NUU61_007411 [Penicillium alfredii]
MGPPRVQFIVLSSNSPEEAARSASKQRKLVHSHAARTAHAKARRLRTIHYQAQKASIKQSGSVGDCIEQGPLKELPKAQLVSLLSADRSDPFMSFATPLKRIEEMLFDHCFVSA